MAHRNQSENSPQELIDLMDYIEENTGLTGDENPGNAHFSAGGTTVIITGDRSSFDSQSILLDRIEKKPRLKINHIGYKSSSYHGVRPYLEVIVG